jgi:hypothetical protein
VSQSTRTPGAGLQFGRLGAATVVAALAAVLSLALIALLECDLVEAASDLVALLGRLAARFGSVARLLLLLDGVLAVEVDGLRVAEIGPGAVIGERAHQERSVRTATSVP